MRSQELDIEILDIQIKGPKDAVVRCTERRIINPRVGSPNTVPARQAVIELEKRGDTWIIKNMR